MKCENDDVPLEIMEAAHAATLELIPEKSEKRYDKEFTLFKNWCNLKHVNTFKEEVFLAYFLDLSKKYKSSSLWSKYSMLKLECKLKHDVDIATFPKLTAFLKKQNIGYAPKKSKVFETEEIEKFLCEAPDNVYLLIKVATVFGIAGACRREELTNLTIDNIEDKGNLLLITIPKTKTYVTRKFVLSDENSNYIELYKKYVSLRPQNMPHKRFFVQYKNGKCTSQVVGINTFGKMPSNIAGYLALPNPELYTGHSFRRTSATMLADSGANMTNLKRHGGWKSTAVAESYIETSIENKKQIANKIFGKTHSKGAITKDERPSTSTTSHDEVIPQPVTGSDYAEFDDPAPPLNDQSSKLASSLNLQTATNCTFNFTINNHYK